MNKEKSDRGRKSKDEQLNGELGVGYGVKRVFFFSPLSFPLVLSKAAITACLILSAQVEKEICQCTRRRRDRALCMSYFTGPFQVGVQGENSFSHCTTPC